MYIELPPATVGEAELTLNIVRVPGTQFADGKARMGINVQDTVSYWTE
jgi:hypothetical protein